MGFTIKNNRRTGNAANPPNFNKQPKGAIMDIQKVLRDLKYRISVTPESDPEYKNAVAMFERLKRKYNINESDLNARKTREFTGHNNEKFIMVQLLGVLFGVDFTGAGEYNFKSFTYMDKRKNNYFNFEVDLTDEEYKIILLKFDAFKSIWKRELKKIEADLKKEQERRLNAFRYSFLDKGNLLKKSDSKTDDTKEPGFTLSDAMKAAAYFDDVFFPDSMLDNQKKQIANF